MHEIIAQAYVKTKSALLLKPWPEMDKVERKKLREIVSLARTNAKLCRHRGLMKTAKEYETFADQIEKEMK